MPLVDSVMVQAVSALVSSSIMASSDTSSISSGEMTWRAHEARDACEGSAEGDARGPKPFAGDKVLHFTWSERGSIALDGLGAFCVLRTAYSFSLIVLRFQRLIASPFN